MEKGGSSKEVRIKAPTVFKGVASTPKFKRRKVSAIRDFSPGCGRVATPNLGLSEWITIDRSNEGKWQ
ncbi:hypothetical protein J1N35_001049 [Gossypium stocksii]|uniref:Uncharacterized protein n=1 Tax=Gossypium stocksii TaxID=47602 RepID=A0A9D3WIM1_9ROSI|nr:hypothetical protein J1N35_001049 [Gossypium stocksii]